MFNTPMFYNGTIQCFCTRAWVVVEALRVAEEEVEQEEQQQKGRQHGIHYCRSSQACGSVEHRVCVAVWL